jgi:RimJ/RimL family protein N-acetyltransferase
VFPLETERLWLRPFTENDVDVIYALVYADSRVREAWSGYAGTLDAFRLRFVREPVWHADDGFGFLAVVRKADDRLLGLMGFQRYEPGEDTSHMRFADDPTEQVGHDSTLTEVELTYALGRAYWGRGYATEAARSLIEFGFRRLGIDRIVNSVLVHPDHRSLALIERLGFRVVENLNSQVISEGPFAGSPGAIGILTREKWKASQRVERIAACGS